MIPGHFTAADTGPFEMVRHGFSFRNDLDLGWTFTKFSIRIFRSLSFSWVF
jgi:hypothetical protein